MRDFQLPGRSPAYGVGGMAATSMPAATLAALDVLRAGGNAVDAAITAMALLAVIEPQSTGIGGDCFCLLAPGDGSGVFALNGSGRTPAALTLDAVESKGITAAHAVTVPGAVSGWARLHARFGARPWHLLFAPAIRAAQEGFIVHDRVAWDWAQAAGKLRAAGAEHLLPGGAAPRAGDRFHHPALARSLRRIAEQGPQGFYDGPIAASLVRYLAARGGLHSEADFADGLEAAAFVSPISLNFGDYQVWQCPPNGAGVAALMMLGMLDPLEPGGQGPLDALRYHRHVEAARLAMRDRDAFVADPDCATGAVARLTDPTYLAGLSGLIDDARALDPLPLAGETLLPRHRDTAYLCVVDRDGTACSFINSLFDDFGAGLYEPETGVVLHNRGAGFSLERGHPNGLGPRKRPLHTILPAMLTANGRPVMPFGVTGGHFQPAGQALLLTNVLRHGLDLQQALDWPRVFASEGAVLLEAGIPDAVAAGLAARGHTVVRAARPHGGGQAIFIDHARGVLVGASDPRRDGVALGIQ